MPYMACTFLVTMVTIALEWWRHWLHVGFGFVRIRRGSDSFQPCLSDNSRIWLQHFKTISDKAAIQGLKLQPSSWTWTHTCPEWMDSITNHSIKKHVFGLRAYFALCFFLSPHLLRSVRLIMQNCIEEALYRLWGMLLLRTEEWRRR